MADRFPLIANSSANQIQEIPSGDQLNLSGNNIANAGIVTATTFVGNLTGNPTGSGANLTNIPAGNLTGTLPAISGANLTNLDASDLASGTIPDARFPSTLPAVSGANLTSLPAQATIANNADNRIITGGSGVNLNGEANITFDGTSLNLLDHKNIYLGTGNDLRIWHDANNSYSQIAGGSMDLYIDGKTTYMRSGDGGGSGVENAIVMNNNGSVDLYHSGTKKLETNANGAKISGTTAAYLEITTTSGAHNPMFRGSNGDRTFDTGLRGDSGDAWCVYDVTASDNRFMIDTSGNVLIPNDSAELRIGAGNDLKIYHDGTDNIFQSSGLKNFIFKPKDTDIGLKILGDGAVELYNDNALKLATTSTGVAITGQAVATGNSAKFQAVESGGATVEIRCGGSEGYIGTQTGHKISFITNASRALTLLNNTEHQLCVGTKGETGNTSSTATVGWVLTGGWTKGVFSGATGANTPWTLYNEHSNFNRYMAYVKFDGGISNHQSNDGNLCDERIKQDFGTVSSQWDNIKNIGLKKFRYTNEPSDAKLKIGVIAQQVETIYPDLVDEDWPIGDADPNTHEKNSGDFYKSVKEEQLQMYSLKALQEAMARIETLEAEVAALKGS